MKNILKPIANLNSLHPLVGVGAAIDLCFFVSLEGSDVDGD
jgi:hypothetical protein